MSTSTLEKFIWTALFSSVVLLIIVICIALVDEKKERLNTINQPITILEGTFCYTDGERIPPGTYIGLTIMCYDKEKSNGR